MKSFMKNTPAYKRLVPLSEESRDFFVGKKVLITGGSGFLGSSLAQSLVELGASVTLLDAQLPLYGGNRFNIENVLEIVEFVEGDIRDYELMRTVLSGQDVVFNLAAQVSYLDASDQPFEDLDINGRGHLTVLEAAKEVAPEATIVFSSSRMVYGKVIELPVREDHPTEPLSLYGIHKLLGEKYYAYYARAFGLKTVSIRIPNPYGPRQQMKHGKYSIVGWFVRQAMDDGALTIYGDGKQARDYLYVDDIVDAFLQVSQKGAGGQVYNVGTHERVTFTEMVDAVLAATGSGHKEFVPWPEDYERNETGDYIADTTKLEQVTGWKPQVMLREGLEETVAYYKKYKDHYWST